MADAPPAPNPEVVANRQRFMDAQITARKAGASWDQIHTTVASHVDQMRQAGATEQQIMHSYGLSNPDELVAATQTEARSEEHTSELQSHSDLVCRLLLEKKKKKETEDLVREVKEKVKNSMAEWA